MEMTDVVTQSMDPKLEEETMKLCERLVRFCFPQAVVTALNPRGVVTADFGSYSMTYSLAGHFSAIELVELSEKAVVLRDLKEEYGEALLGVLGLMGKFLMADYAHIATIALASQEVRLKALKKVLDGLSVGEVEQSHGIT